MSKQKAYSQKQWALSFLFSFLIVGLLALAVLAIYAHELSRDFKGKNFLQGVKW